MERQLIEFVGYNQVVWILCSGLDLCSGLIERGVVMEDQLFIHVDTPGRDTLCSGHMSP
jgi:hypothetical protein